MISSTACFCSDRPNIAFQKVCNQWVCVEKNTRTLACGHAFHNKCLHIIRFLSDKLNKPFSCPECGPHWAKPHDFKKWAQRDWQNQDILYGSCYCSKNICEYDTIFVKKDGSWVSNDPDFTILSCQHIFHKNCLAALNKLKEEKDGEPSCVLCLPEKEDEVQNQKEGEDALCKIERLEGENRRYAQENYELKRQNTAQLAMKRIYSTVQKLKIFFLLFITLNIFKAAGYFVKNPLNELAILSVSLAFAKILGT